MPYPEIFFFDLPVYRIESDKYNSGQRKKIDAQLDSMRSRSPGHEPSEGVKAHIEQQLYLSDGPWRFNEIIGYIRLHFLGSQIRGEYYSAEKKRNGLTRHKVFTYRTHKLASEVSFEAGATNAQIYSAVREYVIRCRAELNKDRYIDDEILNSLGTHIDWQSLARCPTQPSA